MKDYGKELILDLHDCDVSLMTRPHISAYFERVCGLLNMEMCERFWWDDLDLDECDKQTDPRLVGTSAIQFILTSNITIHTLTMMKRVYLNIFSCKSFESSNAARYSELFFGGKMVHLQEVTRI